MKILLNFPKQFHYFFHTLSVICFPDLYTVININLMPGWTFPFKVSVLPTHFDKIGMQSNCYKIHSITETLIDSISVSHQIFTLKCYKGRQLSRRNLVRLRIKKVKSSQLQFIHTLQEYKSFASKTHTHTHRQNQAISDISHHYTRYNAS